jgi:hypothetical protein
VALVDGQVLSGAHVEEKRATSELVGRSVEGAIIVA